MNGKKKNNKKLVLDSGKVSHYLKKRIRRRIIFILTDFLLLKFNIYNLHFLERN